MSIAAPTTPSISEAPQPHHSKHDEPSLFDREELRQFAADDAAAGGRIGRILAALFIYTVFAMGIAIWWTFRTVMH